MDCDNEAMHSFIVDQITNMTSDAMKPHFMVTSEMQDGIHFLVESNCKCDATGKEFFCFFLSQCPNICNIPIAFAAACLLLTLPTQLTKKAPLFGNMFCAPTTNSNAPKMWTRSLNSGPVHGGQLQSNWKIIQTHHAKELVVIFDKEGELALEVVEDKELCHCSCGNSTCTVCLKHPKASCLPLTSETFLLTLLMRNCSSQVQEMLCAF